MSHDTMTPYEIGILLWYYAHAEDHPDLSLRPPIWRPTVKDFFERGLLRAAHDPQSRERCYDLAPRGRAFVESLLRVPLPEMAWITKWPETLAPVEYAVNAANPMGESAP